MDNMDDEDPIIAEVRRVREEIAEICNHDSRAIIEFVHQEARKFREEFGAPVIATQFAGATNSLEAHKS